VWCIIFDIFISLSVIHSSGILSTPSDTLREQRLISNLKEFYDQLKSYLDDLFVEFYQLVIIFLLRLLFWNMNILRFFIYYVTSRRAVYYPILSQRFCLIKEMLSDRITDITLSSNWLYRIKNSLTRTKINYGTFNLSLRMEKIRKLYIYFFLIFPFASFFLS